MKKFVYLLCMCGVSMMSCSNETLVDSTSVIQQDSVLSVDEMIVNLNSSFVVSTTRGSENEIVAYPSDYGGMYINKEGKLVILVAGDLNKDVKSSYALRAGSSGFLMEACEYSYNELETLRSELEIFFADKSNWDFMNEIKWYSLSISNSENRVIVTMDCKTNNIDRFKEKVSSSPLIKFEQSSRKPIGYSKVMKPAALVTSTYGLGSIGYKAKKSTGKVGIVTAGHVVPSQAILLSFDGEYLDNAENIQISGKLDASFVPYDESLFLFSNVTQYGGVSLTKVVGSFVEGTPVRCEGSTSKTVKGGTVKDPSASVLTTIVVGDKEQDVVFSDFIKTTMEVSRGDSGGICYLSSNYNPIGIISCGDSFTYMCKISNINSAFGLSMN